MFYFLVFKNGEERYAAAIAENIVQFRRIHGSIFDTQTLSRLVLDAIPAHAKQRDKDREANPLRRTFQALRIFVNDEASKKIFGISKAEKLIFLKAKRVECRS